jgi:glycosyltransferase involved in cell wall biosynthesis
MIPIQDVYPESLFTSHHYPHLFKTLVTSILLPIDKYYLRNATIIRTISDEMKDYLIATRRLRHDQFLVVNNWQDDDNFEYVSNKERRDVLSFVYVGSINSHSNVELIIKAFVKAKLSNAQLLIYGSGPNKEQCQALVDASGSDQVVFSLVEREDVPRVQSNADVLVLALPKGNGTLCLPSKLTSYLLSGRPVLASVDMDSSTASIINSIEAGIVVIPDDDDLLCDAFKRIYSMPQEQLLLMGQRARCYAEDNLTKAVNLNKVVSAIDKIIKSSNC